MLVTDSAVPIINCKKIKLKDYFGMDYGGSTIFCFSVNGALECEPTEYNAYTYMLLVVGAM